MELKEEIWEIFEAFLLVSISRIFLKKKLSLSCIQPCFPNHKLYPRSSSKVFQSCSGIHFHFFIVAIMSWKAKGETLIPFIFVVLKRLGHMSKRNGDTNIEQVLGYKHVLEHIYADLRIPLLLSWWTNLFGYVIRWGTMITRLEHPRTINEIFIGSRIRGDALFKVWFEYALLQNFCRGCLYYSGRRSNQGGRSKRCSAVNNLTSTAYISVLCQS